MKFINDINTETIIIANNYLKEKVLKMNLLKPIKFMTLSEFIKSYTFSYDEKAILFIMHEYNIKYDIAKEYIENIYYVKDKLYGNSKLDFLVELKRKLNDHNLLIYHEHFKEYAKRVKIIIYDLEIDDYIKALLEGLNYEIIYDDTNNYEHNVYKLNNQEDEVRYVATKVAELIYNGIDINKIKLTNVSEEYINIIKRIFAIYGIPVNISYKSKLSSYDIVKLFLDRYQNNEEIETIINDIKDDTDIYNELIKVINKYYKYNDKDLLIYKINNSYINNKEYLNGIDIIDYLDYICEDNEYIFMLNFNEGVIPKNYMDTSYITDNIAPLVGNKTTRELNVILKDKILNRIKNIKNLTITYRESNNGDICYPSSLVDNFNVLPGEIDNTITYSTTYDKIRLVNEIDNYFKYGVKREELDNLYSNYKIKYNSFDNRFSGIERKSDKLYLSYSKMNTYNKCAFKYYLSNVLYLDIYEENFSAFIGKMVHYVMEKTLSNKDYDIDKYVSEFLGDTKLTKKEAFFLEKHKAGIHKLLDQVLLEQTHSKMDNYLYEQKIDFEVNEKVHFTGIIDKLMYHHEGNNTYLALVDYKTGNDEINLGYLNNGLNMQLPIYLYLASKLDFNNPLYCGFYLQKYNINKDDYRLEGYSNSDVNIISVLDDSYETSKIIKGLKINKEGAFYKTSKVLNNEEIDKIIDIANKQIKITAQKILDNDFKINPKVVMDKNVGCEYCKFKDICFKTKKDEVIINESNMEE